MEALLVACLFGVAIGELLLSAFWSPFYFRVGIPVFRYTVRVASTGGEPPTPKMVEEQLLKTVYPDLLFRDIGGRVYAFREKLFSPTAVAYTPVMRGLLSFDLGRAQLSVTGHLNWFPLVFSVVVTVLVMSWAPRNPVAPVFIVPMVGLIVWLYLLQKRRFTQVAATVHAMWARS